METKLKENKMTKKELMQEVKKKMPTVFLAMATILVLTLGVTGVILALGMSAQSTILGVIAGSYGYEELKKVLKKAMKIK